MKRGNIFGEKILLPPVLAVLFGTLLYEQKLTEINWTNFFITVLVCVLLAWGSVILPIKNKITHLFVLNLVCSQLSVFGGWYAQAGFVSWRPVIAALPLFFLLSAVFYADNLLNFSEDKRKGYYSLAHYIVAFFNNDKEWAFSGIHECFIDAYIALLILLFARIVPPFALLPLALVLVFKEIFAKISDAAKQEAVLIDDNKPKPLLQRINTEVYDFYLKFSLILSLGLVFDKVYLLLL